MIFSNISSLSKTKGIDLFIYAIEQLKIENNLYHIVGKASKVEEDFEKEIIKYVKNKEMQEIEFKGFISNMKEYLESVDSVVLTSIVPDSLPTVLIEGLAKGKVLIATDVGGVREIVDETYGNIIIRPGDIEELKNAIVKVSSYDRETISIIRERNIERAKKIFSIETQVKKVTDLYINMIGSL